MSSTPENQNGNHLPIPPGMKSVTVVNFSPLADEPDRAQAAFAMAPQTAAASIVGVAYDQAHPDLNLDAVASNLEAAMVGEKHTQQSLDMLLGQAHALQAIFVRLSRSAFRQDMLKQYETQLRLALKAQAQCARTLEVLSAIKNPPVFAKQANINNGGQQQVNNGVPANVEQYARARACANLSESPLVNVPHAHDVEAPTLGVSGNERSARAHAHDKETEQTKLLEVSHGKRLDSRATSKARRSNQALETVGEINRTKNSRGQGELIKKCRQRQFASSRAEADEATSFGATSST